MKKTISIPCVMENKGTTLKVDCILVFEKNSDTNMWQCHMNDETIADFQNLMNGTEKHLEFLLNKE